LQGENGQREGSGDVGSSKGKAGMGKFLWEARPVASRLMEMLVKCHEKLN